jgi:acetoacetyl-CoA synthetase
VSERATTDPESEPDDVLWRPSPEQVAATRLDAFRRAAPGRPPDYAALHAWSLADPEAFWHLVAQECGVRWAHAPDAVLASTGMPGAEWFPGAELSWAANLLPRDDDGLAVVAAAEGRERERLSWRDLRGRVARAQAGLRALGLEPSERVAGIVPNGIDALVAMLAATSLGAVWTSCSPDFGVGGIVDRFAQVRPAVVVAADGYRYAGRLHRLEEKVHATLAALGEVRALVVLDFAAVGLDGPDGVRTLTWEELCASDATEPDLPAFPGDHPLYVMYSSGTTGLPKSIVHGVAGTLVQHVKEHQLHCDVGPDSVVFWFTTCGWMMWNWLVSALASGAAIVLYDGSPTFPEPDVLFALAAEEGVTHFGTSPKFLAACEQAGLRPREDHDLSALRAVLSTGAPLNPEQFDYVYDAIAPDVPLTSVSGGTDLLACFVGGIPGKPVRRGRLQGAQLGMAVEAWDERGEPVVGAPGELVCTRPFPSMPLGFWDDPGDERYREAYFAEHPGVWTHGDFVAFDPDGSAVILGRSDTTLNPGGVRIGTAEIYRAVEPLPEVADVVVVGVPRGGDTEIVLCVVPAPGVALDDDLRGRLRAAIRSRATPRHVPARIVAVPAVPYTLSGKRVEKAVLRTIQGLEVTNRDALANPEALDAYAELDLG